MVLRPTCSTTAETGGREIATMASSAERAKMMAIGLKERAMEAMSCVHASFYATVNKVHTGSGLCILAALPKGGVAAQNPRYTHCVERALGLEAWARKHDATLYATDDKDTRNGVFEQLLPSADIVITSRYFPVYLTKERLHKAAKLKLIINLSEGSGHIDLHAAAERNVTVVELAGSSVQGVAEDQVMQCLVLLRNFTHGHPRIVSGQWDAPEAPADAYELRYKVVGTLGGGKVGCAFIKRLRDWDAKELLYNDLERKPQMEMLHATRFVPDLELFLFQCDVVVVNVPLTPRTRNLIDACALQKMKMGAVLINTSHGDIVDLDAVHNAVMSGRLKGVGGDQWDLVPPRASHPWRCMPCHALAPYMAVLTIDAQVAYAQATQEVLDRWLAKEPQPSDYYLVWRDQGQPLLAE